MLNLKKNENDAVFDEICNKTAKIKIKFQKIKGTFLDSNIYLHKIIYMFLCIKQKTSSFIDYSLNSKCHQTKLWSLGNFMPVNCLNQKDGAYSNILLPKFRNTYIQQTKNHFRKYVSDISNH